MVNLLLSRGASWDIPDDDGSLPIHHGTTANSCRVVDALCNAKADVNQPNTKWGATALHHACIMVEYSGRIDRETGRADHDIVKVLLSLKADPSIKDKFGKSALDNAKYMEAMDHLGTSMEDMLQAALDADIKRVQGEYRASRS